MTANKTYLSTYFPFKTSLLIKRMSLINKVNFKKCFSENYKRMRLTTRVNGSYIRRFTHTCRCFKEIDTLIKHTALGQWLGLNGCVFPSIHLVVVCLKYFLYGANFARKKLNFRFHARNSQIKKFIGKFLVIRQNFPHQILDENYS